MPTKFSGLPNETAETIGPQVDDYTDNGADGDAEENEIVNAIVECDNGKIYIGGGFLKVYDEGGVLRNRKHLACWDSVVDDLTSWSPAVTPEPSADPFHVINAICPNGTEAKVYVGGVFDAIDGTTRNNLARIQSDGSLESWAPNPNAEVYAIATTGGKVFVGGDFTVIGGNSVTRFACVDRDSASTLITGWGHTFNDRIYAITLSADESKLYVGGKFTSVTPSGGSATTRKYVAEFNVSDGTMTSWNPDWTVSSFDESPGGKQVMDLAISPDATYLVAATNGTGNDYSNACVVWQKSSGVFPNAPSRHAHITGDPGDNQAVDCNNTYAWIGHHGRGVQSPSTPVGRDRKLYAVRLSDAANLAPLVDSDQWEVSEYLGGSVSGDTVRGTWVVNCGKTGLNIGGGQDTPRRGFVRYKKP